MENKFSDRLKHAWNIFTSKPDYSSDAPYFSEYSSSFNMSRNYISYSNQKSIMASIINQIGIDAAAIELRHVRVDSDGRYDSDMKTGLNDCLNFAANIDQTSRAFIQDAIMSMCDEGVIAIVPIDTQVTPTDAASIDILSMRIGKIVAWYPDKVRVRIYNDKTGHYEEVYISKRQCAICENPLYSIMNKPNSILKRLVNKMNLLDNLDASLGSNKFNMIVQLPYIVKNDSRKKLAESRMKDLESQLNSSKYGIAYTDGTEKITQLNRPLENGLQAQIVYLTSMLYSQLGMSEEVFNGKADEAAQLNYFNSSIEPMLSTIIDSMKVAFISKTARTQGQTIMYFRNPFRLVPVKDMAEIADKFTRNEVLTSNEIRSYMGIKPFNSDAANELRNKNIRPNQQLTGDDLPVEEEVIDENK